MFIFEVELKSAQKKWTVVSIEENNRRTLISLEAIDKFCLTCHTFSPIFSARGIRIELFDSAALGYIDFIRIKFN